MGTLTPQCLKGNPLVLVEDTPPPPRVEVWKPHILTVITPVLERLFCGTVRVLIYTGKLNSCCSIT